MVVDRNCCRLKWQASTATCVAVVLAGTIFVVAAAPVRAQILSAKRGFADTGASYSYLQAVNAGWYHRWGPTKANIGNFDAKFVPMFWGGWQANQSNIDVIINYGDIEWVFGFNEPERPDQANMSVAQAIAAWQVLDTGFDGTGIKLVSPAVSDNGTGQAWLADFMNQAGAHGLQVDAVAFHWYGASTPNDPIGAANAFIGRVDSYHNSYGLPVWITEFAVHDWGGNYSDEEMRVANAIFLDNVIPRLESRSYVAGYAWYTWFGDSQLVEGNPLKPTNVGVEYVGTLDGGNTYDFAGTNLGEHVAYFRGGELTHNSAGGIVHYINALSGKGTISGTVDWSLEGTNWVRVQPGATLRKTGPNQITWQGTATTNQGVIEVSDGVLLFDNCEFSDSGTVRVESGGTASYHDSRRVNIRYEVELDGGTLSTDVASGINALSGATVWGEGAVVGDLNASSGTVVRVGRVGLPVVMSQFVIDDFEGYALGAVRDVASPPWVAHENTMFAAIQDDGSGANRALAFGWNDDFRGASRLLPDGAQIDDGAVATLFFRFNARTDAPDHNVGLGDQANTGDVLFGDFEAQVRFSADGNPTAGTFGLDARSGGAFVDLVDSLTTNTWYNLWMVVNHASDTFDVYLGTGTGDANAGDKLNAAPLSFRNGTSDALHSILALAGAAPLDYGVRIDDLTFLDGMDLTNPLGGLDPQEIHLAATLTIGGDFTLFTGATLELGIHNPTALDLLDVGGHLNAGGTLAITQSPSAPIPQPGDSFDIIDAASFGGAFDVVAIDAPLAPGSIWDLRELYASGTVSVLSADAVLANCIACLTGPGGALLPGCESQDQDADNDVDLFDYAVMEACVSNANGLLQAGCLAE